MNKRWIQSVWLALLGVAVIPGWAFAQDKPGVLVGKKAPEFQIQGIYNEPYTLDTFKGHILVMQFGASW